MLNWLFGPQAQARQLYKDARTIIAIAREGYRVEKTREMALLTRTTLEDARAYAQAKNEDHKLMLERLEMYHRGAKHARDQVRFTAYTLALIYLRAEALGAVAAEARAEIDQFYNDWAHAADLPQ